MTDVDMVAQAGRDLRQLWAVMNDIDRRQFGLETDSPEYVRLERESHVVWRRKEAIEITLATTEATTLEGAMVQIMLADTLMDILCSSTGCDLEEFRERSAGLLSSAVRVIEAVTGSDRDEYGGETYMSRKLDPHEARRAGS